MSQAKLAAAREFIQEKNYEAARVVLNAIPSDTTARQWLAKLNQIAPQKKRRHPSWALTIVVFTLAIVSTSVLLFTLYSNGNLANPLNTGNDRLVQMINAYCAFWQPNNPNCPHETQTEKLDAAEQCFIASAEGQSVEVFSNCMMYRSVSIRINTTPSTPNSLTPMGFYSLIATVTPQLTQP